MYPLSCLYFSPTFDFPSPKVYMEKPEITAIPDSDGTEAG